MQHGKLCLKPVKFFLQSKIYGVETTIESSKKHFQRFVRGKNSGTLLSKNKLLGIGRK